MEPEVVLAADFTNCAKRVYGVRRGRAQSCTHEKRSESGVTVRVNLAGERFRIHCESVVNLDPPEIFYADAGNHCRFFQRGMGLCRNVCDQPSVAAFLIAKVVGGAFAGSQERSERGGGSCVLNDAAAR